MNPTGYRLHIAPYTGRVQVRWRGELIADTTEAVRLEETRHEPIYYVPRKDARMDLFERSTRSTHCPHKGDASYFTLVAPTGARAENAVWSYETPIATSGAIKQLLAFYTADMGADFGLAVTAMPTG